MPMTAEEHGDWRAESIDFLRRPVEESAPCKRKRLAKTQYSQERLPTLDWMRAIEHQLRSAAGLSLKTYDWSEHLKGATIEDGVVSFPPIMGAPMNSVPPVLLLCGDQYSVQTCGASYLKYHLKLGFDMLADVYHSSWNSTQEAVAAAGFRGTLTAGITVVNLAYGPFHRSAWFRHLQAAAHDLNSSFEAGDHLLLHMWDRICDDRGYRTPEQLGAEGRQAFLDTILGSKTASQKGPKAATSRWYSVLKAFEFWDKEWHTKLLMLMYVCKRHGWAKSVTDVLYINPKEQSNFAHEALVKPPLASFADGCTEEPASVVLLADAPESSGAGAASSSSAASSSTATAPPGSSAASGTAVAPPAFSASQPPSPPPMPPPPAFPPPAPAPAPEQAPAVLPDTSVDETTTKAQAVAAGKQIVADAMAASANTIHAVCRIMYNQDLVRDFRMVCLASAAWGGRLFRAITFLAFN